MESQDYRIDGSLSPTPYQAEAKIATNFMTAGGFVDFTYLEASVALLIQLGPQSSQLAPPPGQTANSGDIDSQFVDVVGRVLAKYPLPFFKTLSVFPLAGLEYSQNLSYRNKEPFLSASELNNFFLDLGAGIDFPLNSSSYLRAEGIYGLNLTPSSQVIQNSASGAFYSAYGSRLNFSLGLGSRF
jgi:hypothetical protein